MCVYACVCIPFLNVFIRTFNLCYYSNRIISVFVLHSSLETFLINYFSKKLTIHVVLLLTRFLSTCRIIKHIPSPICNSTY